jgi:hypothetical protein
MDGEQQGSHRRRRRRATAPQGTPPPVATPPTRSAAQPEAQAPETSSRAAVKRRTPRDGGAARGLRDLVGAGPSQLGVSGALRGRDVNRPTADDLAEAERDLVIVRRNWQPDGKS